MSDDLSGRYLRSRKTPLFRDVKAWFSSTVSANTKKAWMKNGGSICDWKDAHFLFSENIEAQDTLILFEQVEFLWGYITVFHTSFISDCIMKKDMKDVMIAPYLLMPSHFPCVKTTDISDDDEFHDDEFVVPDEPDPIRSRRKPGFVKSETPSQMRHRKRSSSRVMRTLDKSTLDDKGQRSSNDPPCGSCPTQFQFCNGVEETTSDSQSLPDLKTIPHMKTLMRTKLPLVDFIPNRHGCEFYRIC